MADVNQHTFENQEHTYLVQFWYYLWYVFDFLYFENQTLLKYGLGQTTFSFEKYGENLMIVNPKLLLKISLNVEIVIMPIVSLPDN